MEIRVRDDSGEAIPELHGPADQRRDPSRIRNRTIQLLAGDTRQVAPGRGESTGHRLTDCGPVARLSVATHRPARIGEERLRRKMRMAYVDPGVDLAREMTDAPRDRR